MIKIDWKKFRNLEIVIFSVMFLIGLTGFVIVEESHWYDILFVSLGTTLLTIPVILIVSSDLKENERHNDGDYTVHVDGTINVRIIPL